MRLRNWLFGHFDAVSRLFGFEMVEGPVLESEELFTRKAGEEIVGQLYNFEVNDRMVCKAANSNEVGAVPCGSAL